MKEEKLKMVDEGEKSGRRVKEEEEDEILLASLGCVTKKRELGFEGWLRVNLIAKLPSYPI